MGLLQGLLQGDVSVDGISELQDYEIRVTFKSSPMVFI